MIVILPDSVSIENQPKYSPEPVPALYPLPLSLRFLRFYHRLNLYLAVCSVDRGEAATRGGGKMCDGLHW